MKPSSSVFTLDPLVTSRGTEQIVRGDRSLFPRLDKAFEGVKTIVGVGWGSQAPAQLPNLRDSFASIGSDTVVKVALRPESKKFGQVAAQGFSIAEGTLGTIGDLVPDADMVLLLINDGAQTEHWEEIIGMMKPGATLGVSHGFLLGYLSTTGQALRSDINVILMAPKGMGDSVRRLYLQGETTEGAGINSSVAVEQDVNGRAWDYAIGWAVGTGSPVTFFTTARDEYISDLSGERFMLLGGVWGLVEALYERFVNTGYSDEQAFLLSTKGLTSTVARGISEHGLLGFYKSLTASQQVNFANGYETAYAPGVQVMEAIYSSVASGDEIREVVAATKELETTPMSKIEKSEMWKVAQDSDLYQVNVPMSDTLAFVAGMYTAGIMAGINTLLKHDHCVSEAINEQLIEIIDSLLPYMDAEGLRSMVDGCSVTARLGTRKWGPVAQKAFADALSRPAPEISVDSEFGEFLISPIHADVEACFALRPSVKLRV